MVWLVQSVMFYFRLFEITVNRLEKRHFKISLELYDETPIVEKRNYRSQIQLGQCKRIERKGRELD